MMFSIINIYFIDQITTTKIMELILLNQQLIIVLI